MKLSTPSFNADSAYRFTKEQVDFGPRVPGTKAHDNCGKYLEDKLKSYGLDVIIQKDVITTYDSKKYTMRNIIAQYKINSSKRILLCAHWDTRPFADRDSVNPDKPFDGANDGAGSVAVLLETARQLSLSKPGIGVDIILFDLEDYGDQSGKTPDSWCLGSQYWAKHLHKPDYFAQFGILLDMVGGKNPVFPKEGSSMNYAASVVNKVWSIAAQAGYGQYFIDAVTAETTDDHVYVNYLANIPCIDIVHYDVQRMEYMPCHHRHCDNMDNIDPATLKMVGQVVLEVVFSEVNAPQ
ncbi:MAG TPA: M28 family peptidase [Bacteroidia bacterium]|nr:M28 family peptidase [Bacteroidia bacterium]